MADVRVPMLKDSDLPCRTRPARCSSVAASASNISIFERRCSSKSLSTDTADGREPVGDTGGKSRGVQKFSRMPMVAVQMSSDFVPKSLAMPRTPRITFKSGVTAA